MNNSVLRWASARESLERTTGRFAALLRGARGLESRAVGSWTAAETAAHVCMIAHLYRSMVRDEPVPLPGVRAVLPQVTVANLHGLNAVAMREFPDRDPHVLAERITADVASMLRDSDGADPDRTVTWLGDSRVPLAGLFAHLVNEMLVHGRDVALATGSPWELPPGDAALFSEVFLVGIVRHGGGRLHDEIVRPPRSRIAVDFRSAYTNPFRLEWDGTRLVNGEPGPGADLRIKFDPATLNLMLFRRISKVRAVGTGKIVLTGRKPWLLPGLLRVVRMP